MVNFGKNTNYYLAPALYNDKDEKCVFIYKKLDKKTSLKTVTL